VLALADLRPLTTPVRSGFRCEALALLPGGRVLWLGSCPAASARLALRWLRGRARDVADQLSPLVARPVRAWLSDTAEQERVLAALARGGGYELPIGDLDGTRFLLSARPSRSPPRRR
jgi:hypothetical protein